MNLPYDLNVYKQIEGKYINCIRKHEFRGRLFEYRQNNCGYWVFELIT